MDSYVSGPYNVVRLEGKINNIDKILYVFFDFHNPKNQESQCPHPSYYIHQYFHKNFLEIEHPIDFFMEILPDDIYNYNDYNKKAVYMEEVRKLFSKTFHYSESDNKVLQNKLYSNVKFHFIDIRTFFFDYINLYNEEVNNTITKIMLNVINNNEILNSHIQYVIENLDILIEHIQKLLSIQKGGNIIGYYNKKMTPEEAQKKTEYILNKIKNKYKNGLVKKKINQLMDKYVNNFSNIMMEQLINFRDQFSKLSLGTINFNNMSQFYLDYNKLHSHWSSITSILTDLYFMRRFLDKDYITTGISYTGGYHSCNYIYILLKYFDFKISHASYSQIELPKINRNIQKYELNTQFRHMFVPNDYKNNQCSHIENLPKNFK